LRIKESEMKKHEIAWFVGMLFLCAVSTPAQIRWSGIFDLQVKKGGSESRADWNDLPNDFVQINARHFNLFFDSDIGRNVTFSAMISNTAATDFDLKQLMVQLANVTFSNIMDKSLSISAGKILTPFGSYARRQLSPDNPLIGAPLFYSLPMNVSPTVGYLDSAGAAFSSGIYGQRMTSIYTGAYYVGMEVFGSFIDGLIDYDAALMNAPLSSNLGDYNIDHNLAIHGRVALHPGIWGTIGVSYAAGSFMQPSPFNEYFAANYAKLEQFQQSTYGMDLRLSYLYYELNAEYILNRFDAPYIAPTPKNSYDNALVDRLSLELESQEFFADLKIDAPFYPGLYLALRYDRLMFGKILDPYTRSSTFGMTIPWNKNANRYAIALGFKPERSVLIKIGYEITDIDRIPKPNLDVAGCSLVITF
jgi:hypothetical protein